jgi:hypothetical protein
MMNQLLMTGNKSDWFIKRRIKLRRVICLAVFIVFLSHLIFAASRDRMIRVKKKGHPRIESRAALVIGNSAYTNKDLVLENPLHDAKDIANTLENCGFDVSVGLDTSSRGIKRLMREFKRTLKNGGVGLFYYAGHAIQVNGKNYLALVDSNLPSSEKVNINALLDIQDILDTMERAGCRTNIVILDACRSNPFSRKSFSVTKGIGEINAPSNTLIVFATNPGNTAAETDQRNGIFTKHLLDAIKEDDLEIRYLLERVRKNVLDETESRQVPWESSSLVEKFYFDFRNPEYEKLKSEIKLLEDQLKKQETRGQKYRQLILKDKTLESNSLKTEIQKKILEKERRLKELQREKERRKQLREEEKKYERQLRRQHKEREKRKKKEEEAFKRLLRKLVSQADNSITLERKVMNYISALEKINTLLTRIEGIRSSLKTERNRKIQASLRHRDDSIAIINKGYSPEKSEFESTADFSKREKKHREQIVARMDKYEKECLAINKEYRSLLSRDTKHLFVEMAEMVDRNYDPGPLKVKFPSPYDADNQRYKTQLTAPDGNYWRYYLSMSPGLAEDLRGRKDSLKGEALYEDYNKRYALIHPVLIDPKLGRMPLTFGLTFRCRPSSMIREKKILHMLKEYNFYDSKRNPSGNFENDFQTKIIIGDGVMFDFETGLLWQLDGSPGPVKHGAQKEWIEKLNNSVFAGYHDWRLPTLEEAASLLESKKPDGEHIAPEFGRDQAFIWTGDSSDTAAWVVDLSQGTINNGDLPKYKEGAYIRVVRSLK